MKSFSIETVNIFFRNFGASYILDLAKLYELCESCHKNPLYTLE